MDRAKDGLDRRQGTIWQAVEAAKKAEISKGTKGGHVEKRQGTIWQAVEGAKNE